MSSKKVWRRVNDGQIQKVYHCTTLDCKYKGVKVAVSSIQTHSLDNDHCSNCGRELSYSHTEVRS